MIRQGQVFYKNILAGILTEDSSGEFTFEYDAKYLERKSPMPVSLTLPISNKLYHSEQLFGFFDGLIPEGWLLDLAVKNWKISSADRMGLLLSCCRECIGAVHILPVVVDEDEEYE